MIAVTLVCCLGLAQQANPAILAVDNGSVIWTPQGKRLPEIPGADRLIKQVRYHGMADVYSKRPVVWVKWVGGLSQSEGPSTVLRFPGSGIVGPSLAILQGDKRTWLITFHCPFRNPSKPMDISVGFANGPWKSVAVRHARPQAGDTPWFNPMFAATDPAFPAMGNHAFASVIIPAQFEPDAYTLSAFYANGKTFRSPGEARTPGRPIEYMFPGQIQDVAGVKLDVRPFRWTIVRSVHLQPGN